MSFQKINNQPNVVKALKGALENERLPHALLFQGPVNSGQREAASELAKAIFCENKKDMEPCGACYHCLQIDRNTHPDFFVLEVAEEARELKVEGIRDLISRSNFKPFSANAKVFVIDEAERMNDIAQNAFLKTLEEPLGRTVFILISSSPQQLLPTIRSRVQTLHFAPGSRDQDADPEQRQLEKNVMEYVFYHAAEPLKAPDLSKLDREKLAGIFDRVIQFYRDLLLIRIGVPEMAGAEEDRFEKEKLSRNFSEEELEERIELFGEMKEKINANLNLKLVLSFLWESLASASARKN